MRSKVVVDGLLEGGEDELVAPDGAEKGVFLDAGDEVGPAGDDPGLGAAEELVAGEGDEVDAVGEGLHGGGLALDGGEAGGVHEGAGAEVLDEGEGVLAGEGGEFGDGGLVGEAFEGEVGAVDFEDEGGFPGEGGLVVAEVGFVGGAGLDEAGSGGLEDFGDAEAAADLDEFAAGDDDLVVPGGAEGDEVAEGDDEGGGAVVDGGGFFRAEDGGEGGFEVGGARAALAGGEVELEVGVAGGDVVRGAARRRAGRGGSGRGWCG